MDEVGTATTAPAPDGETPKHERKVDVWMIVSIVAIVLALIATYFAFSYKGQVDDWEAAANETLAKLEAAGLELEDAIASGVADYQAQIDDLTAQLEESQTQSGISEGELAETQQQLEDAQSQLADSQQDLEAVRGELDAANEELDAANEELAETQAALDDANARLEQLGELVLPNGNYVGPVLGARVEPFPAIIFQDGAAWRVAEVSPDVTITAGGEDLSLEEFSALLQSSDPEAAAVANADFAVRVAEGLVVSIVELSG
jgi:cob(I)alamin adenosyltransferase